MCRVTTKSYEELCTVLLGKRCFNVEELTQQKLYRIEDTEELKVYGLSDREAAILLCGVEIGKRAFLDAEAENKVYCKNPKIVAEYMMPRLRYLNHEEFWVIALNSKNMIIDAASIVKGTLTNCYVHSREIFEYAIVKHAAAICVIHNHPSGDSTPSKDDEKLTKNIVKAGKVMGIPVLDHVIIGDGIYYSFLEDDKL